MAGSVSTFSLPPRAEGFALPVDTNFPLFPHFSLQMA
ncbi:hypothetical protein J2W80_003727 [Methylorubrum extorquens]|nr:hypothetical protein [Methylorubrum extorquens]MCP1588738.1 hypothetical protein [Methylorubrum extorquens]